MFQTGYCYLRTNVGLAMLCVMLAFSLGYTDEQLNGISCTTSPISQSNVTDCDTAGHCLATVVASLSFDFLAGPSCISYVPTSDDLHAVSVYLIPSAAGFTDTLSSSFYTSDPTCSVSGYRYAKFSLSPDRPYAHHCDHCPYDLLDSHESDTADYHCCAGFPVCTVSIAKYLKCTMKDRYFVGTLLGEPTFSVSLEVVTEVDGNRTSLGSVQITTNQNYDTFGQVEVSVSDLAFQSPPPGQSIVVDFHKPDQFYVFPAGYVNTINDDDPRLFGFLKHHSGHYYPTSMAPSDYYFHFHGTDCQQYRTDGGIRTIDQAKFLDSSVAFASQAYMPGSYLVNFSTPYSDFSAVSHSSVSDRMGVWNYAITGVTDRQTQMYGSLYDEGIPYFNYPRAVAWTNSCYTGPVQTNNEFYPSATVCAENVGLATVLLYNPNLRFDMLVTYYLRRAILTPTQETAFCLTTGATNSTMVACADFSVVVYSEAAQTHLVLNFSTGDPTYYPMYQEDFNEPEGLFTPATLASSIATVSLHGFHIQFDSSTPTPVIRKASLSSNNEFLEIETYSTRQSGVCVFQTLPLGFTESKEFTLTSNMVELSSPVLFDKYDGIVNITVLCKTHNATYALKVDFNKSQNRTKNDKHASGKECKAFQTDCYSTHSDEKCGLWGFGCFGNHFTLPHFFGFGFQSPADWVASILKILLDVVLLLLGLFLLYWILRFLFWVIPKLFGCCIRCAKKRSWSNSMEMTKFSEWKKNK